MQQLILAETWRPATRQTHGSDFAGKEQQARLLQCYVGQVGTRVGLARPETRNVDGFAKSFGPFGSLAPPKEVARSPFWRRYAASTIVHANEVAPDPDATTDLDVRFADSRRVAHRGGTDRLRTDPVSRSDRYDLHFGRSWVLGGGFFQF